MDMNTDLKESNRKIYKVRFNGEKLFYYLLLNPEQIRLLNWLRDEYGYDIYYEEQAEVIVI